MTKTLADYEKDYVHCCDAEGALEQEIDQLKAKLRHTAKVSDRAWNKLLLARKREAAVQPGANCAHTVEISP